MRCKHKTADGKRCRAPEGLVNEDGECPAHRPDSHKRLSEAGKKGGDALARRWNRNMKLPPLDSFKAAQHWLYLVGDGVARGVLGAREADAITRATEKWINAQSGAELEQLITQLKKRIRELETRLAKAEGKR